MTDRHEKSAALARQDSLGCHVVDNTNASSTTRKTIRQIGAGRLPIGRPCDSKTPVSRMSGRSASSAAGTSTASGQARSMSQKVEAARKGHLGGKQHRDYLMRLDRARILLAQGLSNLDVAEAMGIASNSVPALKRALGIEVKGFRKGSGRRARKLSQS